MRIILDQVYRNRRHWKMVEIFLYNIFLSKLKYIFDIFLFKYFNIIYIKSYQHKVALLRTMILSFFTVSSGS